MEFLFQENHIALHGVTCSKQDQAKTLLRFSKSELCDPKGRFHIRLMNTGKQKQSEVPNSDAASGIWIWSSRNVFFLFLIQACFTVDNKFSFCQGLGEEFRKTNFLILELNFWLKQNHLISGTTSVSTVRTTWLAGWFSSQWVRDTGSKTGLLAYGHRDTQWWGTSGKPRM